MHSAKGSDLTNLNLFISVSIIPGRGDAEVVVAAGVADAKPARPPKAVAVAAGVLVAVAAEEA
jgi:hypothetical protein